MTHDEGYRPDYLIDILIERMDLKNDRALANRLGIHRSYISSIRNYHRPITAFVLLLMNEASGISIEELREIGRISSSVARH